ncbi:MAG: DUF1566 domain-containing protein [Sphaerochaetaceae bacterium]
MKKLSLILLAAVLLLASCTQTKAISTDTDNVDSEITEYKLPDTGQSYTYDEDGLVVEDVDESSPYWGSDASIEGNELSYQDNGDGTVTDLNTGLMWQQTPDFTRYTYDEALEYVENLNTGGYDDWRLPTIKELYSLADFDGGIVPEGESTPYIDTDYFDFKYDKLLFEVNIGLQLLM